MIKQKFLPGEHQFDDSQLYINNNNTSKDGEVDEGGAQIYNEHFWTESILLKVGVYSWLIFSTFAWRHEQLREPQISQQDVHIDKVEEDLLNQLDNAWHWHGDHGVYRHKGEVIKAVPDVLHEHRESEVDCQVFTYLELPVLEGAS